MGVSRRHAKNSKPYNLGTIIFFDVVLAIISSQFFYEKSPIGDVGYDTVSLQKYEATIINFDSTCDGKDRTDSDGNSYTENCLTHTPNRRFTDDTGEVITQGTNVRSGVKPVIGDTLLVALKITV